MSIQLAEQLKKEWTDKYVTVDGDTPELRRFKGLTGLVKTVNMNCQVLVEFEAQPDIGWYDIAPSFLKVADAPKAKKAAEKKAEPAAKVAPAAAKKPAEGKALSPLELARQQGAFSAEQKAAATPAPTKATPAAEGGKKLSPLELARQQGAFSAEQKAAATPASAKATPTAEGGKKLSPLELARQQGAYTGEKPAAPAADAKPAAAPKAETAAPPASTPPATKSPSELPSDPAAKTQAILELCRQQGGPGSGSLAAAPETSPAEEQPAEPEEAKAQPAETASTPSDVELPSDPTARTQAILALCREQGGA